VTLRISVMLSENEVLVSVQINAVQNWRSSKCFIFVVLGIWIEIFLRFRLL
jgi:hypothetical protein